MATKSKKPTKPRTRRPKQGYLDPTFEPPTIPELDQAAENYYDSVQERLPYTAKEKEAKETLINKMVEHQLVRYEFDGFVVSLTDSKNVAVKPRKEKSDDEGESDD